MNAGYIEMVCFGWTWAMDPWAVRLVRRSVGSVAAPYWNSYCAPYPRPAGTSGVVGYLIRIA